MPVLRRTGWVGGFVNAVAVPVAANGETRHVTFHPGFAIHLSPAALITVVLVGAASAAESTQGTPAASACQVRLSSDRAIFKPLGELASAPGGPAGCGAADAVLLQQIILEDHSKIAVEPPATMRCEMAEAVADFVRQELAPSAAAMGSPLSAIQSYDSYDCRGRNRVGGARLSEHGLANALDIRSVRLKDGRVVRPADAGAQMEFRSAMKTAACSRFSTVLGPGSDGFHEDHIHLDRIERRSGYRMCQWELRDEPRFALQSISISTAPSTPPVRAAVAVVRNTIPLPRPRPFEAATARAVVLPAESRH
jgi:hypothetical protein